MDSKLASLVQHAFSDVVRELAFLFAVPSTPADLPPGEPPLLEVVGRFAAAHAGDHQAGGLRLLCPRALGAELGCNMLGLFDACEVEDEQSDDALRETLNVLLGHLASDACGAQAVLNLVPPEVTEVTADRWLQVLAAGAQAWVVEGQPVLTLAWLGTDGDPS